MNRRKGDLRFQQDRLGDYLGFPLKTTDITVGDGAENDAENSETVDRLAEYSEETLVAALAKRRRLG